MDPEAVLVSPVAVIMMHITQSHVQGGERAMRSRLNLIIVQCYCYSSHYSQARRNPQKWCNCRFRSSE